MKIRPTHGRSPQLDGAARTNRGGRGWNDVARLSGGLCLEGDVIAHIGQPANEVGSHAVLVQPIQVGGAEVYVIRPGGEHAINRDQDLMSDSDGGPHLAASGTEAVILVLEVTAALFGRADRRGDQRGLEMHIAFAGFAAQSLAGAFVV